jgi:hypothetical protein
MLYAGLDLSRQRLDVHVLDEDGRTVEVTAVHPDGDALRTLVAVIARHGDQVTAAIESMNGARFVHDQLELAGWDVEIADALKVKGLAPLAAKTDKIDARVLAELARRDLVPAIWLPDPGTRAERERARFRLHLVRHRTALKNRIHATLIAFGHPVPVSDLFGVAGRDLLARLAIPEPWATTLAGSLTLVDELDARIAACEAVLRALGADHPDVELLRTVPGHRLGARVHDRLRARRHQPVRLAQEARRLHRVVSDRPPVRWPGRSRAARQERPEVPALGAHRGCHPRRPPPGVPRAVRADQAAPRSAARVQGRSRRHRPRAQHRHLAHAHQA